MSQVLVWQIISFQFQLIANLGTFNDAEVVQVNSVALVNYIDKFYGTGNIKYIWFDRFIDFGHSNK